MKRGGAARKVSRAQGKGGNTFRGNFLRIPKKKNNGGEGITTKKESQIPEQERKVSGRNVKHSVR